jgi:hypothetical protein
MPKPNVDLPGVDFDFSTAVVEAASASYRDLELKVSGVEVPGRRISRLLLRFEGIEDFDMIWHRLNTKVVRRGKNEQHNPWPLKLPAALKTLVELKSRGRLKKFQFAVAEEHFKGRKKPLEFSCKRLCITDLKGKTIAGDVSKISSFRKWKQKDFLQLADQFATAIEARRFETAHQLLNSSFAARKTLAKMTNEFERLMKRQRHLEYLREELGTKESFEHGIADDLALPDLIPKQVDADDVVTVVQTSFLGWFAVDLVMVDQNGKLQIGHYSINRDWEAVLF